MIKKNKKSTDLFGLQRLADKFSKLYSVQENIDIEDLQAEMRTAGTFLYNSVRCKRIYLGSTPKWIKTKPIIKLESRRRAICSWDLYWLGVIAWLVRRRKESGIARYIFVKNFRFRNNLLGSNLKKYLAHEKKIPRKRWPKICHQLARTSEDACLYLLNRSERPEGKSGQNNVPDDLIDLAKAIKLFHRSRSQIKRDIQNDKIKDYRKIPRGKHLISISEANKLYLPKQ